MNAKTGGKWFVIRGAKRLALGSGDGLEFKKKVLKVKYKFELNLPQNRLIHEYKGFIELRSPIKNLKL